LATSSIWWRAETWTVRGGLQQGPLVLREGLGDRGHPGGDVVHGLLAGERHEVERAARPVQRGGDDVELAGRLAGVIAFEGEAEPLLHGLLGHALPLTGRLHGGELGEGAPVEVGGGGEAFGREVGQLVIVAGDPDIRGADGVELRPLFDIGVGDGINGVVSSHEADPT
jgi:hypothetical protein